MTKLINFIAPFLPAKVAIINSILSTMPESTKKVEIGRIVAKQIPDFHLKLRPYKLHPNTKIVHALIIYALVVLVGGFILIGLSNHHEQEATAIVRCK